MKLKKLLYCLPVVGALVLSSCSSSFNGVDEIKAKKEIIVATNATFQPFEYIENNEFKGIDIDFMKAYADSLDVELKINNIDFDAIAPTINSNKADVGIAGMTKTEKREKIVSFTKTYYKASQVVIVKNNSVYSNLTTADDILAKLSESKAKIGAQKGTTGEAYIQGDEDLEFAGISGAELKSFDDGIMATQALSNGQIDAVIIDKAPADLYIKKYNDLIVLNVSLTEEEYAIACAKGNDSLIDSLNEFIDKSMSDGSLDAIISKYYVQ